MCAMANLSLHSPPLHTSRLNSLKGGYKGGYIGDEGIIKGWYYRGY